MAQLEASKTRKLASEAGALSISPPTTHTAHGISSRERHVRVDRSRSSRWHFECRSEQQHRARKNQENTAPGFPPLAVGAVKMYV